MQWFKMCIKNLATTNLVLFWQSNICSCSKSDKEAMSCTDNGQKTKVPDKLTILFDGQLRGLGITKDITIHCEQDVNVSTKFHCNQCDS